MAAAAGPSGGDFLGGDACRACHRAISETFARTAHATTSRPASARTIRGHFAEGENVLATGHPQVYVRMERRVDGFYQVGHLGRTSRAERFDLVVGSGRRGQTYLSWMDDQLVQLPASYLTAVDRWVSSPGFPPDQLVFDRPVLPRCLECHATFFEVRARAGRVSYGPRVLLGVTCEVCHGPGGGHVALRSGGRGAAPGPDVVNPARLPRDRQIDGCALCHSGSGSPKRTAFSYRPGEPLADHLGPAPPGAALPGDVHANQVQLLRRSRCFLSSRDLSCTTCHAVHRENRDPAALSRTCARCHPAPRHRAAIARLGSAIRARCVDCHMPVRLSRSIAMGAGTRRLAQPLRDHTIGIYPEESDRVLGRTGTSPERTP